jgi:(E)-4-hydroxy-3-methylbut-2-enyl-diphosphate synthase
VIAPVLPPAGFLRRLERGVGQGYLESMAERRRTRPVKVGKVTIGGDAPVSVQSMTTTKTTDIYPTLQQIRNLEIAGCDIVRVTVPDEASAEALPEIKAGSSIPLVADFLFN